MGDIGDEHAVLEEAAGREPEAIRGGRRDLVVEQPIVGPEWPVKPHGVIDRGGLHVEADQDPVRHRGCREQREVAGVGERRLMQPTVVRQRPIRAYPNPSTRRMASIG